jgi:hypothetical protein
MIGILPFVFLTMMSNSLIKLGLSFKLSADLQGFKNLEGLGGFS